MTERVWDRYLTPSDRAHIGASADRRVGPGKKPALLLIDLYRSVFGDKPEGYEGIFGNYRHIFVARTKQESLLDRAQDGGVVTGLLVWAREQGLIDGAAVSTVTEEDKPCFPSPRMATTVEEIKASAASWYTYVPNNLALEIGRAHV